MSPSSTAAKLIVITGPARGEVFSLSGANLTVGRDPTNQVWIPDRGISRSHCEISWQGDGWQLRDLGSSNGTFVNGLQASLHTLEDGDHIAVGTSMLVFAREQSSDAGAHQSPTVTSVVPVEALRYLTAPPADSLTQEEGGVRALLALSAMLHTVKEEDELFAEVLNVVGRLTGAEATAFVIQGPDGELHCAAHTGGAPTFDPAAQSTIRQVLQQRSGVIVQNGEPSPAGRTAFPSFLCVPVTDTDSVPGVICAIAQRVAAFNRERLPLVLAVGYLAGIALRQVRTVTILEREAVRLQADLALQHSMVGDSAPMQRVYDRIARVARSESTVLLTGETGTGKELAARAIHLNGPRAKRPFVAINSAAVAENLLESELFGHERGAFTGAVAQKRGKLELADGGTLFLDEVAELTPALQGKLLRALQEQEFERVGGTRTIKVDVRVIAATNATLSDEVARGRFRADLYFRLNVVNITMPPLRERQSDIPSLARFFLERVRGKVGRRLTGFSTDAMACLMAHSWPGNVRELQNVVERAAVLGLDAELTREDLPEDIVEARASAVALGVEDMDYHAAVVSTKKRIILEAFKRASGSYVGAARLLHVHPNYLHRLIRTLDLKSALEPER